MDLCISPVVGGDYNFSEKIGMIILKNKSALFIWTKYIECAPLSINISYLHMQTIFIISH